MVVLGHLWYQSNIPVVNIAIYSFHMPLFFIVSGFVIKSGVRKNIKIYIKQQTIRLLLPAYIFIIIYLPVYVITSDEINLGELAEKICFWKGSLPYNLPCWFFIVLYEAKIIERILDISNRTLKVKILICIVAYLGGYIVYQMNIFLPFGLNRCLVALGFLVTGVCIKDIYQQKDIRRIITMPLFYVVVLVLWILSGVCFNTKVSMYDFALGKYWLFILSGISGSIVFVLLCRRVDKLFVVFRRLGNNTIFIVGTHYIFVTAFKVITGIVGIQYTRLYGIMAVIFTGVLICCYIPVCDFVNKYIPVLNGRGNSK